MPIIRLTQHELDLWNGVHDFSSDTLKCALFDANAAFTSATTVYSTSNEVTATGYTAGGATLSFSSGYPQLEDGLPAVRFVNPTWTLTDTASIRYALIYNDTASNDEAILAIDLGQTFSVLGDFTINFPLTLRPIIQRTFALTT